MSRNSTILRVTTSGTQPSGPSKVTSPAYAYSNVRDSPSDSRHALEQKPTHQRFVLADPVAFRYLEEDPSTQVLARREKLQGYECYIVEQWACSRAHPTFVITAFTGDPSHTIVVSVLSVPTDEDSWSPRLKVYFKALSQYHAKRRETSLGTLMITNLSSFPSSLTVILVPEGDIKSHREDFFVNENLKRLGCTGRVGITLGKPSPATKGKFYQLYRASDKVPFDAAVIELVKLCQVALMLFGKLQPEYADGLLCDVTEKAINDWWIEFGTEYYNIEPHDGILGPTTVAALLGMLTGARNRLSAYGAPISKDVFDVESTTRAIASFQRSQRIPKSRRLDRQTLNRLHRVTAKAASGQGWTVPKAVKSTVAELSGKGGEMVMDMVGGGRDKAGIAEVETADIEQFVQLVHGARLKWLWKGKPRKQNTGDLLNRVSDGDNVVFQSDEHGGYEWSSRVRGVPTEEAVDFGESDGRKDHDERHRLSKKHSERTHIHRTHDSRGLGRLKDAVPFKGHHSKQSKDERGRTVSDESEKQLRSPTALKQTELLNRVQRADEDALERSATHLSRQPTFTRELSQTPTALQSEANFFPNIEPPSDNEMPTDAEGAPRSYSGSASRSPTASIAGSNYHGVDLDELFMTTEATHRNVPLLLRRRNSFSQYEHSRWERHHDNRFPRHLSFTVAEDSVLPWLSIIDSPEDDEYPHDPNVHYAAELAKAEDAKRLAQRLGDLEAVVADWVSRQLSGIEELERRADTDTQQLDATYYPRADMYHALEQAARQDLDRERAQLQEAVKEIEVLAAKLEYEINALRGRIEDVEDGVDEFERQVASVEDRVEELEADMRPKEGWLHWIFRLATGIGKKPGPPERKAKS